MKTEDVKKIGKIRLDVVGIQYYDGARWVRPGDELVLVREPENRYDSRAIRVENTRFEPVGYIPRVHSAYLSPLIDEGKIGARCRAGAVRMKENAISSEVSVYAHPKGTDILDMEEDAWSASAVMKNLAAGLYANPPDMPGPEASRLAGRLLKAVSGCPDREVFLIVNMLECRIKEKTKDRGRVVVESTRRLAVAR